MVTKAISHAQVVAPYFQGQPRRTTLCVLKSRWLIRAPYLVHEKRLITKSSSSISSYWERLEV